MSCEEIENTQSELALKLVRMSDKEIIEYVEKHWTAYYCEALANELCKRLRAQKRENFELFSEICRLEMI